MFAALANLATSINGLAGVLDSAAGRLRQQLDYESSLPALPPAGVILDAENGSPTAKRGRKS